MMGEAFAPTAKLIGLASLSMTAINLKFLANASPLRLGNL